MNRQERRRQQKLGRGGPASLQSGGPAAAPLAAEAYRRAVAARQAGRPQEAWELCQRILHADPGHGEAAALAGLLAWQRGDYGQAQPLLQKAMKLLPGDAAAISNYGVVLQQLGQYDEAIKIHRKAVRAAPAYVKAHANLGAALLQAERCAEAVKAFRRALDLDQDFAEAQSGLGVALQKLDDLAGAVAAHREAVRLMPGQGAAHYNLAAALLAQGEPGAALESCEAGLAAMPGDTRQLALKVGLLQVLGDHAAAGRLLDYARFLRAAPLEVPAAYDSQEAFNQALAESIEAQGSLQYEPPAKATRGGWQSGEILAQGGGARGGGALEAFKAGAEAAVARYIEDCPTDCPADCPAERAHPFLGRRPADWRLKGWAVVLKSGGHQSGHIHPQAWLSAVYYVQVPAAVADGGPDHAGWIEFGRPGDDFPAEVRPEVHLVRPQAGLLVLFPSYFYHRTLPFTAEERRISIAFDVIAGA